MQWELIKLRKEARYSQLAMAKLLGINVDSYGSKERGQTQFTSDEMFVLKKFFSLPIEEIFLPRNFINTAIRRENK